MFNEGASGSTVKPSVALRTRSPYCRSFASIEHSELKHCEIRRTSHDSAKRVDFSYHSAFCDPADSGIAGHLSNRLKRACDEGNLCPSAGGRDRSLSSGMTATHYQDVEIRFD
jgi:hypothetical protein